MPFDKFIIGEYKTGLETDNRPWRINDDAFQVLLNAYVFRGRIRKRFGSELMNSNQYLSRLRISIGSSDGSGNVDLFTPQTLSSTPILEGNVGQLFTVGTNAFTAYTDVGSPPDLLRTDQLSDTATYDFTTGEVIINNTTPSTPVYWYPGLPVMGISQYLSGPINDHPTFAFDTTFSYFWTGSGWDRSGTSYTPFWHTTNDDYYNFFWTCNWQGSTTQASTGNPIYFVSNFQVENYNGAGSATDDPLWSYDGTNWTEDYFYFLPSGAPATGPYVVTARIVVPFKDRLVLLNTVENNNGSDLGTNTNYVNRCRFSWNGSPFAPQAWYEPNQQDTSGNIAGGAGYIDAYTEEQIISAQFVKDRLIVYFERSTWELAYTGNEIIPFVWQKLNTELGSQSTFSTVPFDTAILTVGNTGIHSCNGSNVARIDSIIPQQVFSISTENNNTLRTTGIRDYVKEMVYWTYVSDDALPDTSFPNKILVYNYKNGSWAINDDCFTAFGYFEQITEPTWLSTVPLTWEQYDGTWISGIEQSNQRVILAGNQEGYISIINPDIASNANNHQITNIVGSDTGFLTITVINHNLVDADTGSQFVYFSNIVADPATMTFFTLNPILQVYAISGDDGDDFIINTANLPGGPLSSSLEYFGGGTLAYVSNIQMLTKQYNPYLAQDKNVYIQKIDFGIGNSGGGQITIDYYPSATELSMIESGEATGSLMGTSVLETSPYVNVPLEFEQERLYHPIYFQSYGECIQLYFYFSYQQITNPSIAFSDFELESMCLFAQPVGRLQ